MDNKSAEHSLKVRIVHPDGRRQKFVLNFSERKVVRLDQKRLGVDIGAVIEFIPGAILCRPASGFTMTANGFTMERTPIEVGSKVKINGFEIEFLELPEPPPQEEATRVISIRVDEQEAMERTVVGRKPTPAKNAKDNKAKGPSVTMVTDPAIAPVAATPPSNPVAEPAAPVASPPPPVHAQTQSQAHAHTQPHAQVASSAPFSPVEPPVPLKAPAPPSIPSIPRDDATAILRRMPMSNARPNGPDLATLEATPPEAQAPQHDELIDEDGMPKHGLGKFMSSKLPLQIGLATMIVLLVSTVVMRRPVEEQAANNPSPSKQASSQASSVAEPPPVIEAPHEAPPPQQAQNPAAIVPAPHQQAQGQPTQNAPAIVAPGTKPSEQGPSKATQPAQATGTQPAQLGDAPSEPIYAAGNQFDAMSAEEFFAAIDRGDSFKVREMVDNRTVDVNLTLRRGYSALHVAAARGDLTMVKLLLKYKANPNARDPAGSTALMWAVYRRHTDVVKRLAPITDLTLEREGGLKALDLARSASYSEFYKMLTPKPPKATKTAAGKKRDARKTASDEKASSLPSKKKKK